MPPLNLGKAWTANGTVKSENDRLSDTQRLWIHVLTSAGMNVELCAARTKDKGGEKGKAEKRKKGARSTA